MSQEQITHGEMLNVIREGAIKDSNYRAALLKNPKKLLGMQMGMDLPENLEVRIVQDTPNLIHIPAPHVIEAGAELSDADLEKVAGGKGNTSTEEDNSYTCNRASGVATRVHIETEASIF